MLKLYLAPTGVWPKKFGVQRVNIWFIYHADAGACMEQDIQVEDGTTSIIYIDTKGEVQLLDGTEHEVDELDD